MKAFGLMGALLLIACGARGKAKPAEVEIEWPDSGVVDGPQSVSMADAGPVAPTIEDESDAMPSPEAPR